MKACKVCGVEKPLDDYYLDKTCRDGHWGKCKSCANAQSKAWNDSHPESRRATEKRLRERQKARRQADPEYRELFNEKRRASHAKNRGVRTASRLKRVHGITSEQFNALLEAQGNCCAICKRTEPLAVGWHVDHDHSCCPGAYRSCGKCVRGILCAPCNVGLGSFQDDPENTREATHYLEKYKAQARL